MQCGNRPTIGCRQKLMFAKFRNIVLYTACLYTNSPFMDSDESPTYMCIYIYMYNIYIVCYIYNHQSIITYPHRHVAHFPGSTAPTKSDPGGPGECFVKAKPASKFRHKYYVSIVINKYLYIYIYDMYIYIYIFILYTQIRL